MTKKPRRVVVAEGYFDTADCRRKVLVFSKPLENINSHPVRCSKKIQNALTGRKVRIVLEVL